MKGNASENAKNRDWKTPMTMPGADRHAYDTATSGDAQHAMSMHAMRRKAAPNEAVPESTRRLARQTGKSG